MPKTAKNQKPKNALAVVKDETVDAVLSRVQEFQSGGELHMPDNYSAANALKSAWLILQNVVDKDKKPVLEVCTRASIANALLDMVIQGLNPAKSQCYFIAYGRVLTLSRSYQGNKAICLRVDQELYDINAECIYEGDEIEYDIKLGQRIITKHKQKLENVLKNKIIAAYCVAYKQDGSIKRCEMMTMDQIKAAWAQSRMNPVTEKGNIKSGTTHDKFTDEMCKKTVTNRLTKHIMGMSDDKSLNMRIAESVARTDDEAGMAFADEQIEKNANKGDVIDITGNEPARKDEDSDDFDDLGDEMTEAEKREILAEEAAAAAEEQAANKTAPRRGKAPF